MSSDPIRFAIVGSGNIAAIHATALAAVPGTRLAAVCSRNLEKAALLAAPTKARVFSTPEELLAEDVADAVLIATPSGAHADAALPALQAGRHVLCEKPLEIHSDRILQMITEAKRYNVILAGFFPLRSGVGAQTIRDALGAGRFGRLTFLSARVKWWRDPDYYAASSWRGTRALDGGGALMNQGIHAVDLLQWMGGEVVEVVALAGTLAHPGIEVEDTLAASVRFSHGALGTIEAATSCRPGLDFSLEISGTEGTAILINDRIEFWEFQTECPEDDVIRKNESGGVLKSGSSDPRTISNEGHRRQIQAFCQAIRGDKTAPLIDGREAGRSVTIVEAIYRSVRSGTSEKVSFL